jgi:hypothetical protein
MALVFPLKVLSRAVVAYGAFDEADEAGIVRVAVFIEMPTEGKAPHFCSVGDC